LPSQVSTDQQQADNNTPEHVWSSDENDRMWRNYRLAARKDVSLGQNSRDAGKGRQEPPSSGSHEAERA
jgi:hypothetical protein